MSIPQHKFVLIAGDFNTRIDSTYHETFPSVIGSYTYHDQTGANGQYLTDFCEEQYLITAFYHELHMRNQMSTWGHPKRKARHK